MDDKAETFVESLLGDIFGCIAAALNVEIKYLNKEEKERFVPYDFYCKVITFSKIFMDELATDIWDMPVLLCSSEDFFKRFTNSVCLKLIDYVDPDVGFLKVMSFLLLLTSMSFVHSCYRAIDDIPLILQKLLKEHIKTRFYEEDGFEAISLLSESLKEDKNWCESSVKEMQTYMKESLETELAATKISHDPLQPDRTKVKIIEVKNQLDLFTKDEKLCPFCGMTCINFLNAFYKPKIMYKPWVLQK